jgi:hypothetical protein
VDTDWTVIFRRVRAFLHRAEALCDARHYESSYDRVVEAETTTWSDLPASDERLGPTHNFVMTLDSWGCLEVLAGEVAVISP